LRLGQLPSRRQPRVVPQHPRGRAGEQCAALDRGRAPAQGGGPWCGAFQSSGCIACHTYAGSGTENLGAPDLTAIGARHLGMRFEISHLKCPACVNPGSPMPTFRSLGKKRLRELAVFLEASKGIR
jgi:hypothetical protein